MTEVSPKFEIDQLQRDLKRHEELVEEHEKTIKKLRATNSSLAEESRTLRYNFNKLSEAAREHFGSWIWEETTDEQIQSFSDEAVVTMNARRLRILMSRDPNAGVTTAIMRAERALDETVRLYEQVAAWEKAIVDSDVTGIERDIALRGVAAARVTLGVLRGLQGER